MIKDVIYGLVPSKSNQYRCFRNRIYKSKKLKEYEETFAEQTKLSGLNIDVTFSIKVDVYLKNKHQDVDNTLKILLDCMQSNNIISNDDLCYHIDITKHVDKDAPRVEYEIEKYY